MELHKAVYMYIVLLDMSCLVYLQDDGMEMKSVETYLETYQYLGAMNPDPLMKELVTENNTQAALTQAILIYQKTWGLPETGTLNRQTLNMIAIPRCGMPDIQTLDDLNYMASDEQEEEEEGEDRVGAVREVHRIRQAQHARHRVRRYLLSGYRHRKLNLTYSMVSYPRNGPSRDTVDRLVDKAYQIWQDASELTFMRVGADEEADIVMSFRSGNHRDYKTQERDFNDLAHAFYPDFFYNGSQIHFNDDKVWVDGRPRPGSLDADLAYVTLHEVGHALGLGHVLFNNKSVMHPYYQPGEVLALDQDDINGINALYDKELVILEDARNESSEMVMSMDIEPMMSDFCDRGTIDAITLRTESGVPYVYAFQGNAYVRMRDGIVEAGYPRLISKAWPGLPADIEAISSPDQFLTNGNDFVETLRFVKNGTYYFFKNQELIKRQTVYETPKKPRRDSIFSFGKTGREYHILDGKYFHRGVRAWRKLEYFLPFMSDVTVDAAFSLDRKTSYFFSGTDFYVVQVANDINDPNPRLLDGYPKDIAKDFLHCGPATIMMIMADQDNSTTLDSATASGQDELTTSISGSPRMHTRNAGKSLSGEFASKNKDCEEE